MMMRDQQEDDRAPRYHQRPVGSDHLDHERDQRRQHECPGDPHGGVAREARPIIQLERKRLRLGVEEQRGELEIELGIEAENDADHKPQRQGDEESSPVHGARFSGVGRR